MHARYVVIGAGGIGSAAAYWLSRRAGREVLCLEQFEVGHRLGASEDHSRIIRRGYHAERYTALTGGAYEAWRVVEEASGVPLVHVTGILNIAPEDAPVLAAYRDAMDAQGIPYEELGPAGAMARWPQFRIPDGDAAIHQPDGGILDIRKAGAVHRQLARGLGATVLPQARVTGLHAATDGVEVRTTAGVVRAEQVVLCAGAWNSELLAMLGVRWPIRLTHEQVTYFATPDLRRFAPDRFPVWIWQHEGDDHYGFPVHGEVATKAALEALGDGVELVPQSWEPDRGRVAALRRFLDAAIPGFAGPELYTRCCLYDLPPDRDFVLDRVPGHPNVSVAVGAGHAAKFAGLFGRILADLVLDGSTAFPIGPFEADRPALTDPAFEADYRLGGSPPRVRARGSG